MILLGCCEAREKVNHRTAYRSGERAEIKANHPPTPACWSSTRSAPATTCWGSRIHRPACASARGAPAHSPGALGTDPRGSRDTAAEVRFLWQTSSESVAQAKPARAIQSSRPFLLPAKGCLSVRPFHHRQAEPGGKGVRNTCFFLMRRSAS
jgi:hypothetical protein